MLNVPLPEMFVPAVRVSDEAVLSPPNVNALESTNLTVEPTTVIAPVKSLDAIVAVTA